MMFKKLTLRSYHYLRPPAVHPLSFPRKRESSLHPDCQWDLLDACLCRHDKSCVTLMKNKR